MRTIAIGVLLALAPPGEAEVQGLYEGTCAHGKLEGRLVALGGGTFRFLLRHVKDGGSVAAGTLDGKLEGDTVALDGATVSDGKAKGTCGEGGAFEAVRVVRKPPTLGQAPPDGAIVLLDGKNFENVEQRRGDAPWNPADDGSIQVPKGGFRSARAFGGSFDLHVEFRCNLRAKARGQGRGNSGVYLPNGDEIQVLDSFGVETYLGGGCGGIYKYKDPDAFDVFSLASLPPEQWQTYDVAYRVEGDTARVTVRHNGVLIHDNFTLKKKAGKGRFNFQDHGNPVRYRNIWVVPKGE